MDKVEPSDYATAFRKAYSIKNNVLPHRYNRYFLCIDIENFFPSIKINKVNTLFKNIGFNRSQAYILSKLCTCNNFLPQGGVTSPAISNLIVNRLNRRLSGYSINKKIIYTRYADDMTFSSNNRNILNYSITLIKRIIEEEGYAINSNKTHFIGPGKSCKITGLIKNSSKPEFGIGKEKKNWMRSVIFNLAINNRVIDKKYPNMRSILGWLNYVKYVDRASFEYMHKYCIRLGICEDKIELTEQFK